MLGTGIPTTMIVVLGILKTLSISSLIRSPLEAISKPHYGSLATSGRSRSQRLGVEPAAVGHILTISCLVTARLTM